MVRTLPAIIKFCLNTEVVMEMLKHHPCTHSHSMNHLVKLSKHLILSCTCFEIHLEILNAVSEAIMKRQRFTYTVNGP